MSGFCLLNKKRWETIVYVNAKSVITYEDEDFIKIKCVFIVVTRKRYKLTSNSQLYEAIEGRDNALICHKRPH